MDAVVARSVQRHYDMQYALTENMSEDQLISYVLDREINIANIKQPSLRVQLAAVTSDPMSIKSITNPYKIVQITAVSLESSTLEFIENPFPEVLKIVQADIHSLVEGK